MKRKPFATILSILMALALGLGVPTVSLAASDISIIDTYFDAGKSVTQGSKVVPVGTAEGSLGLETSLYCVLWDTDAGADLPDDWVSGFSWICTTTDGYNPDVPGNYTFRLDTANPPAGYSFTGYSTTYEVTVQEPTPSVASVTASPTTLDKSGGTTTVTISGTNLPATYSVGAFTAGASSPVESASAASGDASARTAQLTLPANTTYTNYDYTIKYSADGGNTWADSPTATVTVLPADAVITGLGIKTLPTKTTYLAGEPLDLTGGVLAVQYSDGTETPLDMASSDVTPAYDFSSVGTKTVTLTAHGYSAGFDVTVNKRMPVFESAAFDSEHGYIVGETAVITATVSNFAAPVIGQVFIIQFYDGGKLQYSFYAPAIPMEVTEGGAVKHMATLNTTYTWKKSHDSLDAYIILPGSAIHAQASDVITTVIYPEKGGNPTISPVPSGSGNRFEIAVAANVQNVEYPKYESGQGGAYTLYAGVKMTITAYGTSGVTTGEAGQPEGTAWRYEPRNWSINPSGTFALGGPYSADFTVDKTGTYNPKVEFMLQVLDNGVWVDTGIVDTQTGADIVVAVKTGPAASPQTGDTQPLMPFMAMMAGSAALLCACVLYMRKRKA